MSRACIIWGYLYNISEISIRPQFPCWWIPTHIRRKNMKVKGISGPLFAAFSAVLCWRLSAGELGTAVEAGSQRAGTNAACATVLGPVHLRLLQRWSVVCDSADGPGASQARSYSRLLQMQPHISSTPHCRTPGPVSSFALFTLQCTISGHL